MNGRHGLAPQSVAQEWPGLPIGVKFDPSDQEIRWHLLAKVGAENSKPHPFMRWWDMLYSSSTFISWIA
ncbi:unnamed protein product [Sphenostylis stenocarpa]|uniref:Uncharacterized protein n=1 Tax=Sphenostylis stenocarpa TaxID=92480 RepID=A0AA87B6B3_9FABA|nr:unnamed protein product [Sphenostylis stenocarpa]